MVRPPLLQKLIFIHKCCISFFNKFVEKSRGSFVAANPRRLGCASTQDDRTPGVKRGKEAARFAETFLLDYIIYKTRRFLPPCYPLNPVILNELVLSLRRTSEMKDLLIFMRIWCRVEALCIKMCIKISFKRRGNLYYLISIHYIRFALNILPYSTP